MSHTQMTINLAEQCNFTFSKLFYISAGNVFYDFPEFHEGSDF